MTAHLVRLNPGRCGQTLVNKVNKVNQVVVWVADASVTAEADARAAAAAAQPGRPTRPKRALEGCGGNGAQRGRANKPSLRANSRLTLRPSRDWRALWLTAYKND